MKQTQEPLWERFKQYYSEYPSLGLSLDISRMNFPDSFFASMEPAMKKAFAAMAALEGGAMANPDEKRMVGHYWLRNPALAPTPEIREEIESTVAAVKEFARKVHQGELAGKGGPFNNLLVIGIGGSALGPEFVANALSQPAMDKLTIYFFDNTDPDGMDKVFARIGPGLGQTLCVVISKSHGTQETRNGRLEAQAAYQRAGIAFGPHFVAITGAKPAALQGFDITEFLRGAGECDVVTRKAEIKTNPAAQLALTWYYIGNAKGAKDMVILPYKDRLELFSRYLQQLVMESLGKEKDLDGKTVNQGIAVYGNKGSTDQHAYIQQLRDGLNNFFVTFISVAKERSGAPFFVKEGITAGDFLQEFLLGTRQALHEKGRESIALTLTYISAFSVGVLIALFECAVGFYGDLVRVNAYHQPGVEAGKIAANAIIDVQTKTVEYLKSHSPAMLTQIAAGVGSGDIENVFTICEHLSANPNRKITKIPGLGPFDATYRFA